MISAFWTGITSGATAAGAALGSIFSSGFGLIYDGTALTDFGELLVLVGSLGLLLGVVYLVIRFIPKAG